MDAKSHYFINRSGLKLHYLQWGTQDKPTVIMLHGLRSYALTWHILAPILATNFNIIALDQRGRGLSDWADFETYQTAYYVNDIEDLLRYLDLSQVIIVGHSLGGANALEFTRLHPQQVTALVIEDIGPGSSIQGEGAERIRKEMLNTPLYFKDWHEAATFWKKLRPLIDENGIQSRLQNTLIEKNGQIEWRHDQQGIAKARLNIPSVDLWPAVNSLHCPVLFVKGGQSDFLSQQIVAEMKHKKPDLEIVEIAGASHYVHDDQPQQFNTLVSRFLNDFVK